jgi:hypothetical protein
VTKETQAAVKANSASTVAKVMQQLRELESDKHELTVRLNTAVGTLEKTTARVVEDANAKLLLKDGRLKQMDEHAVQLQAEGKQYKKIMDEYKRQLETREAIHEEQVRELQGCLKDERVESAQQVEKIASLEGLSDGFRDKVTNPSITTLIV